MNEEKLVKLLEKHFPTKREFLDMTKHLDDLDGRVMTLKHRLISFVGDMEEFRKEMREFKAETKEEFKILREKIDDLKHSSNTFDKILEKHPIERIERLEKHTNLSPFVPAIHLEE